MREKFPIIALLLCTGFALGCGANHKEDKYSQVKQLMGTYVQIDTCSADIKERDVQAIYQNIWSRLEEIGWRMNVYDARSDVAKINQAYAQPVRVQSDTYDIVKKSLQMNYLTKGAFDITIGPLTDLWTQAQKNNILPDSQDVKLIKQAVGSQNLNTLADYQVQLIHPLTKIDLGGIAKGYALDEAARLFRESGIKNFYIDAGGDIYVGGLNCKGEKWRIGIQHPGTKNALIEVVLLSNAAITTSGNYEQYFSVKDQNLSHIINPVTGYPQQGVISATVIGPSATEADALATALTVLGKDEGTNLIERLGHGYVSLIILEDREGSRQYTSKNFNNYRLKKS